MMMFNQQSVQHKKEISQLFDNIELIEKGSEIVNVKSLRMIELYKVVFEGGGLSEDEVDEFKMLLTTQ